MARSPSPRTSVVGGGGVDNTGGGLVAGQPYVVIVSPSDAWGNPWVYRHDAYMYPPIKPPYESPSTSMMHTCAHNCACGCIQGNDSSVLTTPGVLLYSDPRSKRRWGGSWLSVRAYHSSRRDVHVDAAVTAVGVPLALVQQQCGGDFNSSQGDDLATVTISVRGILLTLPSSSVCAGSGAPYGYSGPHASTTTSSSSSRSNCSADADFLRSDMASAWVGRSSIYEAGGCGVGRAGALRQLLFVAVYTPVVSGQYAVAVEYVSTSTITNTVETDASNEGGRRHPDLAPIPLTGSPFAVYVSPAGTSPSDSIFTLTPAPCGALNSTVGGNTSTTCGSAVWQPRNSAVGTLVIRDAWGNVREAGWAINSTGSARSGSIVGGGYMWVPLPIAVSPAEDNVTLLVESTSWTAFGTVITSSAYGGAVYTGGNGTYDISLPCTGSLCTATVTLTGADGVTSTAAAAGSSVSFIQWAGDADAVATNAWGPGLFVAEAGVPACFMVQARDAQ